MIQQLSPYEYLGNSLFKINSNMNELNIRFDNLYEAKERWSSLSNTIQTLSAQLNTLTTIVNTTSGQWKAASDLVYNVKGYWEEPIQIVYKTAFNLVGNYLEIEGWLNENFPSEDFSPTQTIRCDFLCKNYNSEALEGTRFNKYEADILEPIAKTYGFKVREIFDFLGFDNQLNAIINMFNTFLRKNLQTDLIITSWVQIDNFNGYIKYNKSTNKFVSEVLTKFPETDLRFIYSYLEQFNMLKVKYQQYIDKGIGEMPLEVIGQFKTKNILNNLAGRFFFRIINGRWTYYPYTHIEFCSNNVCSDCYDSLDVNALYGEKTCVGRVKYLLTECEFIEPYFEPYVGMASISIPEIITLASTPEEQYSILDKLFS